MTISGQLTTRKMTVYSRRLKIYFGDLEMRMVWDTGSWNLVGMGTIELHPVNDQTTVNGQLSKPSHDIHWTDGKQATRNEQLQAGKSMCKSLSCRLLTNR